MDTLAPLIARSQCAVEAGGVVVARAVDHRHQAFAVLGRLDGGAGKLELGFSGAALARPGGTEGINEGAHCRTFDAHMRVAPMLVRGTLAPMTARACERARGIHAADVDAAGERDPLIHHQHLAMVAVIELQEAGEAAQRADRIELAQLDAARAQLVEESHRRGEGAHAVVDDMDGHALGTLLQQSGGDALAVVLRFEDVAFDQDAALGAFQRFEH